MKAIESERASKSESECGSGRGRREWLPFAIGAGVVGVLLVGGLMMWRADRRTNKVALASRPKPVTVVRSKASMYRPSRTYAGTLRPWNEASIGPQFVSAYVETVLVRPGAVVRHNQVLATLDCRDAQASSKAAAASAAAVDARQRAVADEAKRTTGLLHGGFVSPNEAEQKVSESASEAAQLEAEREALLRTSLQVGDCVLRAPFDGEIARRYLDPGAFVRPGSPIVTVVDRDVVRMSADAPEIDFELIPPGAQVTVHVYATNRDVLATISRRSPSADRRSRTVHFEVDIADPKREIPVGTTGEVRIAAGQPAPATEVPLYSSAVRGRRANLFEVSDDGIAHARSVAVAGELGGSLFLATALPAGRAVVLEGRALLEDGDRVTVKEEVPGPAATPLSSRPGAPAEQASVVRSAL